MTHDVLGFRHKKLILCAMFNGRDDHISFVFH